jgi:hypothetical protein
MLRRSSLFARAILITIHHDAAIPTAIHPYPERHMLFSFTDMAHLGRFAFINYREFVSP